MLRPVPGRTFHQRTSACKPSRVRPAVSRRASRPRIRAGVCATYAGPRHRTPSHVSHQPLRATATPLPSHWLQDLTARVGTSVHRLLAIARRELTAALVPLPEHP
jgi:hypothetical protein